MATMVDDALIDTNILVRMSDAESPLKDLCKNALKRFFDRGDTPYLCAQNAIEFWAVATRPKSVNGLGLAPAAAEKALKAAEQWLVWLPEPADIATRWRALVNKHGIIGKRVHDTRLIALMGAYGLTNLLTLNAPDFACFEGITCLQPGDIQ
jgi:predicted nucleic acid-binding protein